MDILFSESVAHTLIHTSLQLAFEVLGVDDCTGINCCGHLYYLHLTSIGIDVNFGHLNVMNTRFERGALTSYRIQRTFLSRSLFGSNVMNGLACLCETFICFDTGLFHSFFELFNGEDQGPACHICHPAGSGWTHFSSMVCISGHEADLVHGYAG